MEFLRVDVSAMTASFRYPMFVVSYQPTYPIPPISTIYGFLSAAKGSKVSLKDVNVGYTFTSGGTGVDLERIHEYGNESDKKPPRRLGTNILKREFLYDCHLTLYLSDTQFGKYLRNPAYTLLLGRQTDLAVINGITLVNLKEEKNIEINNTVVPFDGKIPGQIVALPSDFTDTAARKPLNVKTYAIITSPQKLTEGYLDPERGHGIYIHDFNSTG
jgi:CRISPR-associated protein Cas5t